MKNIKIWLGLAYIVFLGLFLYFLLTRIGLDELTSYDFLKSNSEHLINFKKSNPILQKQRSIKNEIEIELIRKACSITKKGFERVLKFVKPDVWEYEIEAEFSHEFLKNRSKRFAYTPIIASGNNSNYLHYIQNNKQCKSGDIILMDVGAEYANYSSDMTRTIPVNGRFSERQKTIYNAVLNVKKNATELLRPGILWNDYHIEVGKIMTSELLKIGLLEKVDIKNQTKKNPAYKKYFSHGTSHHLGLDTHDYCDLNLPLEKNMVLTVEPGIYIMKAVSYTHLTLPTKA